MRLELTHVGLLVELANHYTTRGACITYKGWYAIKPKQANANTKLTVKNDVKN